MSLFRLAFFALFLSLLTPACGGDEGDDSTQTGDDASADAGQDVGEDTAADGGDDTDSDAADRSQDAQADAPTDPVTETIGSSGGAVTTRDGVLNLDVPESALSEDTAITLSPLTADEISALGFDDPPFMAFRLQPDGLQFDEPVRAEFALMASDVPGYDTRRSNALIPVLISSDGEVEASEVSLEVDTLSGTIALATDVPHFSTLAIWRGEPWARLDRLGEPFPGDEWAPECCRTPVGSSMPLGVYAGGGADVSDVSLGGGGDRVATAVIDIPTFPLVADGATHVGGFSFTCVGRLEDSSPGNEYEELLPADLTYRAPWLGLDGAELSVEINHRVTATVVCESPANVVRESTSHDSSAADLVWVDADTTCTLGDRALRCDTMGGGAVTAELQGQPKWQVVIGNGELFVGGDDWVQSVQLDPACASDPVMIPSGWYINHVGYTTGDRAFSGYYVGVSNTPNPDDGPAQPAPSYFPVSRAEPTGGECKQAVLGDLEDFPNPYTQSVMTPDPGCYLGRDGDRDVELRCGEDGTLVAQDTDGLRCDQEAGMCQFEKDDRVVFFDVSDPEVQVADLPGLSFPMDFTGSGDEFRAYAFGPDGLTVYLDSGDEASQELANCEDPAAIAVTPGSELIAVLCDQAFQLAELRALYITLIADNILAFPRDVLCRDDDSPYGVADAVGQQFVAGRGDEDVFSGLVPIPDDCGAPELNVKLTFPAAAYDESLGGVLTVNLKVADEGGVLRPVELRRTQREDETVFSYSQATNGTQPIELTVFNGGVGVCLSYEFEASHNCTACLDDAIDRGRSADVVEAFVPLALNTPLEMIVLPGEPDSTETLSVAVPAGCERPKVITTVAPATLDVLDVRTDVVLHGERFREGTRATTRAEDGQDPDQFRVENHHYIAVDEWVSDPSAPVGNPPRSIRPGDDLDIYVWIANPWFDNEENAYCAGYTVTVELACDEEIVCDADSCENPRCAGSEACDTSDDTCSEEEVVALAPHWQREAVSGDGYRVRGLGAGGERSLPFYHCGSGDITWDVDTDASFSGAMAITSGSGDSEVTHKSGAVTLGTGSLTTTLANESRHDVDLENTAGSCSEIDLYAESEHDSGGLYARFDEAFSPAPDFSYNFVFNAYQYSHFVLNPPPEDGCRLTVTSSMAAGDDGIFAVGDVEDVLFAGPDNPLIADDFATYEEAGRRFWEYTYNDPPSGTTFRVGYAPNPPALPAVIDCRPHSVLYTYACGDPQDCSGDGDEDEDGKFGCDDPDCDAVERCVCLDADATGDAVRPEMWQQGLVSTAGDNLRTADRGAEGLFYHCGDGSVTVSAQTPVEFTGELSLTGDSVSETADIPGQVTADITTEGAYLIGTDRNTATCGPSTILLTSEHDAGGNYARFASAYPVAAETPEEDLVFNAYQPSHFLIDTPSVELGDECRLVVQTLGLELDVVAGPLADLEGVARVGDPAHTVTPAVDESGSIQEWVYPISAARGGSVFELNYDGAYSAESYVACDDYTLSYAFDCTVTCDGSVDTDGDTTPNCAPDGGRTPDSPISYTEGVDLEVTLQTFGAGDDSGDYEGLCSFNQGSALTATGPDRWFRIDVPAETLLRVTLIDPPSTTRVVLTQTPTVVGNNCNVFSNREASFANSSGSVATVHVTIDDLFGAGGLRHLEVTFQSLDDDRGLTCSNPIDLSPPTTITGNTLTGVHSPLSNYYGVEQTDTGAIYFCGLNGNVAEGPEHVYRVTVPDDMRLDVVKRSSFGDVRLVATTDCNVGASCRAYGSSDIFMAVPEGPQTYYIFVEGQYDDSGGAYEIDVAFTPL